jgi:sortase A
MGLVMRTSTGNLTGGKAAPQKPPKAARLWERLFLSAGLVLLAICVFAYLHRALMLRVAMNNFEYAKKEATNNRNESKLDAAVTADRNTAETTGDAQPSLPGDSHVSNSAHRVHRVGEVPLAILRIPKIQLEVPVLKGTDDITLNRGVGQIAGTASPGQMGNIGIAGHRDGFFRNLKGVNKGDVIELETTTVSKIYVVDRILITGPDDVSVLQPRDTQSLTLVTCYPFHFIGPAPRRFIVEATLKR